MDMKLAQEPFEMIANGEKTVEVRLYDEKRAKLKLGDTIRFTRVKDNGRYIDVQVVSLKVFRNFYELFTSSIADKCGVGNLSAAEAAGEMYKYYTPQDEVKFGVLAIGFELI